MRDLLVEKNKRIRFHFSDFKIKAKEISDAGHAAFKFKQRSCVNYKDIDRFLGKAGKEGKYVGGSCEVFSLMWLTYKLVAGKSEKDNWTKHGFAEWLNSK